MPNTEAEARLSLRVNELNRSCVNPAILGLFECQVLVDGRNLHEYEDDETGNGEARSEKGTSSKLSTTYIEAVSGANFVVKFGVKPGFRFAKDSHLGMIMSRPVISKAEYSRSRGKGYSVIRSGSRSGSGSEWALRKVKSSEITTSKALLTQFHVFSDSECRRAFERRSRI